MATKLTRVRLSAAVLVIVFAIGVFAIGEPAWPQSPTLTVTLTGQSMMRSDIRSTAPANVPTMTWLVRGADVVFTNLESVVAEPGQPNESAPVQGRGFLTPPEAMDALRAVGFNLIATSNNHLFDLRIPGVLNTLKHADRVGLPHAGTGKNLAEATAPAILKTPHGTVALVAMASSVPAGSMATATQPGVNELRVGPGKVPNEGNVPNEEDAQRILQSIRDATKKADLVIVYQHNHVFDDKPFGRLFTAGSVDRLRPAGWLKKWVHAEIDAGADLIVMHGAPLLHGIEIYKGKPIFYDLGNFIFNAPLDMWTLQEPMTWQSVVPTLQFQGKNVQSIKLRPVVLNFIGEGEPSFDRLTNNKFLQTRGLPAPAEGDWAEDILQRVAELSAPFGTKLVVKGDTAEVVVGGGK